MADFLHFDVGELAEGNVVVVALEGNQANVRLMDEKNLAEYRDGKHHAFHGGLATESPFRVDVPGDGHWHVVVDLAGLDGSVNAAVELESEPGVPIAEPTWQIAKPRTPLERIYDDIATIAPENPAAPKEFDVVIVHEFHDKLRVVSELAKALRMQHQLKVGVDPFTLRKTDDARAKIDTALTAGRFGIVMLTPNFFAMGWPDEDLKTLVTWGPFAEWQVLLPVWYSIKPKEAAKRSRQLAEKTSLSTAQDSIKEIAAKIAAAVHGQS